MQERAVQGIDIISWVKLQHPTLANSEVVSDELLLGFKNMTYSELWYRFGLETENQLEDACYTLQQQYLVADIVALLAYNTQVATFSNDSTTEKTARTLKKGKAGSAEAEFEQSGDNQFVVSYQKQIDMLYREIIRKCLSMNVELGFIYDLAVAPDWVRESLETPEIYVYPVCL